ncbi:MAG: OsmC family protein [Opitutaceae bacterium]
MKSNASAMWQGNLKQGRGTLSSDSGVLKDTPYSFATRFEGAQGTNPEELIAAAHAGCFSMALSMALGQAGFTPERIATRAEATLEQVQGNWTISSVRLECTAKVPGIDRAKFDQIATGAKANCPVSRVLKTEITLHAALE